MAFSKSEVPRVTAQQVVNTLVILPKSAKPREAGGLNEGVAEILRVAQDDKLNYEQIFKKRTVRRAASSRENRQDE